MNETGLHQKMTDTINKYLKEHDGMHDYEIASVLANILGVFVWRRHSIETQTAMRELIDLIIDEKIAQMRELKGAHQTGELQ